MSDLNEMNPRGFGGIGFNLKTIVLCAVMAAPAVTPAFALSDLEIREKRSAEISAVKKSTCAEETPDILKLIDYSAALIFHNELEEAKGSLSSAMAQAKSQLCKKDLLKIIDGL